MDQSSSPSGVPSPAPGSQDPWAKEKHPSPYVPLVNTLRLYAGWVLAWGLAALTLVAYGQTRKLPFSTVFVDVFGNLSSLILIATAAFLFLVITSIHRMVKGRALVGVLLMIVWIAAVFFIQQNIN